MVSRCAPALSAGREPLRAGNGMVLFCVFSFALLLYGGTAARAIQWQDRGAYVLRVVTNEPENTYGLALVHPLHFHLCRIADSLGLVPSPHAVALVSSVFGAVTVGLVFACVCALTGSRKAGVYAGFTLSVAHTFWQMSAIAEVYTVSTALLALEILCVVFYGRTGAVKWLWWGMLVNGLGVSNHVQALLSLPVLGSVLLVDGWRREALFRVVAVGVGLWIVGAGLYGGYVIHALLRGDPFWRTMSAALFGNGYADEVLNVSLSARVAVVSVGFVLFCFPNSMLPAAIMGVMQRSIVPRVTNRYLLGAMVMHAGFACRYPVADQYTFFLPTYVLIAVLGGVGFALLMRGPDVRRRRLLVLMFLMTAITPVYYAVMPMLTRRMGVLDGIARNKPYRDDYVYLFVPWAFVERSADRMSLEASFMAGDDGVIVYEDTMASFAIAYRLHADRKSGVDVVARPDGCEIDGYAACGRNVVLVPRDRDLPATDPGDNVWDRWGDLYVLR